MYEKIEKLIFGCSIILLSFCALFLLGSQRKQEQLKPLEHEVTVELVVVEVFVTDKEGSFIDNLTKDDFEIFEDGKRAKIQYFAVITPEKEIPKKEFMEEIKKVKKPLVPQQMKLVILFDNLNTNRFSLTSQWPQIEEMFKSLSSKVEETMVIDLSRESGASVIQPFTSDQNLLSDIISKFKFDLLRFIQEEMRRREMEDLEKEARLRPQDRFISNPFYVMDCFMMEEKIIGNQRLSDSFGAFLGAVNYIRQFEGIKAVLIVSDGFRLQRTSEKGINVEGGHYQYLHRGVVKLFDPFKLFGGKKYYDHQEAFEKFLQLINEEKIIFYAFSPKEFKSDFSVRALSLKLGETFKKEMERWSEEKYSLQEIADETGGMYLRGQKKYENFVEELGRDLTHFYDISYAPSGKRKKGYHKIEVKVKKPGLTVRYKKGYSDFTDEEIERRKLASAFLSPSAYRDIAFSCKTDFIALRGGYLQFWIRLKVPLDQFRKDQYATPPEKMALLFGLNEWTEERVHTGGRMLRIREATERGLHSLYRAFITSLVDLKPGDYDARVILKQGEDRVGGWEDSLIIPDIKKESSLSVINSICGFLRKEEKESTVPFSVSIGDGSLLLSHYRFYPLVENILNEGRKMALLLQICSPKEIKNFDLRFSLQDDKNAPLQLPFEEIESFFDKKLRILSEVNLLDFKDISPGNYHLRIESLDRKIIKQIEIKIIPL
ncbi:MAG: VWA domain-containing protein [Candidatus Aminicenantaceae bacterium]